MSLVSVIIPTYNREFTLSRALDSVNNQTFKDWELIVVDDGSTDSSDQVFEKFKARAKRPVRWIRLPRNRGVSAARNAGARAAQSEWLAFLDSDDEWLPHKLDEQLKLRDRFRLIHGEEIWIRNGTRILPKKQHRKSGGEIFERCVDICCISPSTAMIHRDLFREHGGFNESFPVCEDYELWLKVCAREAVGFVEMPVQNKYGGHADQLSISRPAFDFFRVRALSPLLIGELEKTKKDYVAKNICARCEILLKGYQKYPDPEDQAQVERWLDLARNFLTQNQSPQSAADLRPRSDSSTVLNGSVNLSSIVSLGSSTRN